MEGETVELKPDGDLGDSDGILQEVEVTFPEQHELALATPEATTDALAGANAGPVTTTTSTRGAKRGHFKVDYATLSPPSKTRRESHNATEQRRRDKIREKIDELKSLVPDCDSDRKAAILQKAVDYIRSLRGQIEKLEEQNRTLASVSGAVTSSEIDDK